MWKACPFVRIAVPFAAGIACGEACPAEAAVPAAAGMALCAGGLCFSYYYRRSALFGVALLFFLFLAGAQCLFLRRAQAEAAWPETERPYRGVLLDKPSEKARSFLCPVETEGREVWLYAAKDSLFETLRRGDELLFYARVAAPARRLSSDRSGYARYLRYRGVSGMAYVAAGRLHRTGARHLSFRLRASDARDSLTARYRALGFEGDELAVLSALTLGDKSGLDDEVKETYSVSGASHVLALSGLHIGILYGIGAFLLSFLSFGRFSVWLRTGCLLALLWGFSFMAGLSPSVVRAACMFSLFAVARCLHRRSLSWNTLALSAFLMLLGDPYCLFQVGFQLSYAAVAAIIWLHPMISGWWMPSGRVFRYVWGILSVSLAAQAGVAPLILLYFSRFSVYFLLANLIVVPLAFCLVAGTLLMLACGFCLPLQQGLAGMLDEGVRGMNAALRQIGQLPCAAVDEIEVGVWGVVCFYLLLFFFVSYCRRRQAKCLSGMLAGLAGMAAAGLMPLCSAPNARMLFGHASQGASVRCSYAGKKPFELFAEDNASGLYRFGGKTVAWLKDDRWAGRLADAPLTLDFLFVQRGFTGKVADLLPLFAIRRVVLDTSLSAWRQERLKAECRQLGIPVFALSEKGSWQVEL